MVYIFLGDHPFKLRVGVFGIFFRCMRSRGLPKESHAGTTGWCGKDFRAIHNEEKNARDGEKVRQNNAKIACSLHNAYYAT